jgi:hypothetical protein
MQTRALTITGLTAIFLASWIAIACSSDEVTPGVGGTDAQPGEDGSQAEDDSSSPQKDSGSGKDGSSTGGDAKSDTGPVGDAITISDSDARFTTRSFTDYTCPDVPGLGRVLRWVIPQDIRVALNLPTGAYFQIESASDKNVLIAAPPAPDKQYFVGSEPINVALSGMLPQTIMKSSSPATGEITVAGKWTCP